MLLVKRMLLEPLPIFFRSRYHPACGFTTGTIIETWKAIPAVEATYVLREKLRHRYLAF